MKNLILPAGTPSNPKAAPFNILSGAYAGENTLTNLIPQLYDVVDVVSRELVGFIPSSMRNANAERAAVGQTITYPISNSQTSQNISPSMTVPEPRDREPDTGSMAITKAKAVEFGWTGEEQKGLNTGVGYLTIQQMWFAEALRTLTNEIENDLGMEAAINGSRAYGDAGTTPFAANHSATAQIKKILDDNGAPSMRSLVIDTAAGANLRSLNNLTRVNEAGTSMTLRDGELLSLNGLSVKESAGVQYPVIGTAAATADTNNAGYAVGSTVITLASAGTGTILAGDVIQFAGDSNKYVVKAGDTDVSGGGTITLQHPGLRVAIPAAATESTVVSRSVRNVGFSMNALHLLARQPERPAEGDMAIDVFSLTDPRSGLVFEVSLYPGYRKIRAEVALAWGVKAVKPEHIALLLG